MELTFESFMNEKKTYNEFYNNGDSISFDELRNWMENSNKQEEFKNLLDMIRTYGKEIGKHYKTIEIKPGEREAFMALDIVYKKDGSRKVYASKFRKDIDTGAKTTTVKSLSKGKLKKFKVPKLKPGSSKYEDLLNNILVNMDSPGNTRLLIKGDPGTGKSKTIENIMSFLRLEVITIEAPHISEDDVINIPYLIKRGGEEEEHNDTYKTNKEKPSGFDVINAESALVTRLKKIKPIKDMEYNSFIKKNKMLVPLLEDYSYAIEEISSKYKAVLFLDEFYRTGSTRIQNLLRTILNGKIGNTPIPKDVYIIYSSNMDNTDMSLDDIPENHQFESINFDKPSKDDFFRYMADKFTNLDINDTDDDGVDEENIDSEKEVENPIKMEVYNAFMDAITDEDLGGKDISTGIRVSPRRWEEIIKYINASLPVSSASEARSLITFLRDNFKDYRSNQVSSEYPRFKAVLDELIKETSNIDSTNLQPNDRKEWRNTVDSQIKAKIRLGEDRKYVPIISGKPGIGKTTIVQSISTKYNLKQITIDVSTLNSDVVIGLPTPEGEGRNITTNFSTPPLYNLIMEDYDANLKPMEGSKYTHILFLDEISRTNTKVFNAIRALLLDKKVGGVRIPDNIMIIAAMNPTDTGATELSDHMVDTVDVIDAEANFEEVMEYFKNNNKVLEADEYLGFKMSEIALSLLRTFATTFASDVDNKGDDIEDLNTRKFYWTDDFNVFYISAREFDAIITGCTSGVKSSIKIKSKGKYNPDTSYSEEEYAIFADTIVERMISIYTNMLDFISKDKAGISSYDMEKFMIHIKEEIINSRSVIIDNLTSIKSELKQTFKEIFDGDGFNIQQLLDYPETKTILEGILEDTDVDEVVSDIAAVINDMSNYDDVVKSSDDLIGLFAVLDMVDWNTFNNELKSRISDFIFNGFKNITKYALNNKVYGLKEHADDLDKQEYPGKLDIIFERISNNKIILEK